MNQGNITLKRKLGEYSVGMGSKGIFAVRYSGISGGNRIKIVHSGNYFFVRYGGENEMKKAMRDSWYADFFANIKKMIEQKPVLSDIEISGGEYLLAHLKDEIINPNNIALIGLLCKKTSICTTLDVWGDAYKFISSRGLDLSDSRDAEIKSIIDERIRSAGLEKVLKV